MFLRQNSSTQKKYWLFGRVREKGYLRDALSKRKHPVVNVNVLPTQSISLGGVGASASEVSAHRQTVGRRLLETFGSGKAVPKQQNFWQMSNQVFYYDGVLSYPHNPHRPPVVAGEEVFKTRTYAICTMRGIVLFMILNRDSRKRSRILDLYATIRSDRWQRGTQHELELCWKERGQHGLNLKELQSISRS